MLFVGAAVCCGVASLLVKNEKIKKKLYISAGALWSCNIFETLLSSSYGYLGNAKNPDQAQYTLLRMKKMAPEICQTI